MCCCGVSQGVAGCCRLLQGVAVEQMKACEVARNCRVLQGVAEYSSVEECCKVLHGDGRHNCVNACIYTGVSIYIYTCECIDI